MADLFFILFFLLFDPVFTFCINKQLLDINHFKKVSLWRWTIGPANEIKSNKKKKNAYSHVSFFTLRYFVDERVRSHFSFLASLPIINNQWSACLPSSATPSCSKLQRGETWIAWTGKLQIA